MESVGSARDSGEESKVRQWECFFVPWLRLRVGVLGRLDLDMALTGFGREICLSYFTV